MSPCIADVGTSIFIIFFGSSGNFKRIKDLTQIHDSGSGPPEDFVKNGNGDFPERDLKENSGDFAETGLGCEYRLKKAIQRARGTMPTRLASSAGLREYVETLEQYKSVADHDVFVGVSACDRDAQTTADNQPDE